MNDKIFHLLDKLVASSKEDDLNNVVFELDTELLDFDFWPEEFFGRVVWMLSDQTFLGRRDSWKIVKLIADNWRQLTTAQLNRLRPLLEASFDKYNDWMGAFVSSEILGEHYCDGTGLDALIRLSGVAQGEARALVPHGLEIFARTTIDDVLRGRAIEKLHELAKGP